MIKRIVSVVILVAVMCMAFGSSPQVAQAGGPTWGWSQSMWTWQLTWNPKQYDCVRYWTGFTEHCRKVVTGLNFHPNSVSCPKVNPVSGRCYYLVFNGTTTSINTVEYQINHNGYNDYMWGVPTSWFSWQGNWQFKLMDGSKW